MKRSPHAPLAFEKNKIPRLKLPFAAAPGLPAAHLSLYPEFQNVSGFPSRDWPQLDQFAPRVLVGYAFDLLRLAERVNRLELSLASVDHAIFALTDCGSRPLTDVTRVTLWQTFGVPVYELIIAPGCRLLAAECEAHDGWHLQQSISAYLVDQELVCDIAPLRNLHTGMTAAIETAPCPCGRRTVRLKDLSPHQPRNSSQPLAAVA